MNEPLLLLDWGNSALKGMIVDSGRPDWSQPVQRFNDLDDVAQFIANQVPMSIAVASVRSDADNHRLQALAETQQVAISFAQTSRQFDEFSCSYAQPERMGVDRWLALLAVKDRAPSGGVLDIGSAITLDLFVGNKHLGGQIAPGLPLLQRGLRTTARVRFAENSPQIAMLLGQSTDACVDAGLYTLLSGYLEKLVRELEAEHRPAQWWLCGGGATYWAQRLPFTAPVVVDHLLVLKGLCLWHQKKR